MTDKEKLEAIRAEIHRLVDVRGYDREMANDLLTFMDSLPNEPVSDFEMALTEMIDKAQQCVVEPWAIAAQWKDYLIELAKSEEPVSEKWIEELTTKLDSMSKEDFKKVFDKYAIDFNEEPTSVELEKAANEWNAKASFNPFYMALDDNGKPNGVRRNYTTHAKSFKAGAKWQKNHLWKPADGDDLPEIDREVISLLNNGKVVFAHRPYKGKYIGKNLTTGNIETFENKTYDKGGWNQHDIRWWLDVELPKEIEL